MKKWLSSILIILVIVIVSIVVILVYYHRNLSAYTNNPDDWVNQKGSVSQLNVDKASMGQAEYRDSDILLHFNDSKSSVIYEGYYKGEYFEQEYLNSDGKKLMEVTNNLNPKDGIIQGLMIERIIDGRYEVLIFVDEDWKKAMPSTNIIWGSDYQFTQEYDFGNPIREGIYYNKIIDDPTRFGFNHMEAYSAIIVGDISQKEVGAGDINKRTLILFQ